MLMNKTYNTKLFYSSTFPEDWGMKKLSELGYTYTGLSGKSKTDFGVGKPYIPYLNIFLNSTIKDGEFDFVKIESNENQSLVKNGDLFFTTSSETPEEVGMCSSYCGQEKELYLNSFCFGFRPNNKNEISSTYITELFRSKIGRRIIYKLAQGATRYNLSKTALLKEIFPLPPLPEQIAIAHILSLMDIAINKNNQLIEKKELQKKWLMQNLLTGKKRLKGFDGKWNGNKLEHFIEEYIVKPKKGISYEVFTSSKIGLMKQTDYYGNNRITNREDVDYNVIPPNYLTYRSRSEVGLFTFNKNNFGVIGLVSGYYPVFTIKNGSLDFILIYINFNKYKLKKFSIGTSQLVLSMNALKTAYFSFPNQKEQTAIAKVLQVADTEIQLLKSKTDRLKEKKKWLMQVLLTGKKRLII